MGLEKAHGEEYNISYDCTEDDKMEILKRSGAVETYDPQKIINAMKKAFSSVDKTPAEDELEQLLAMLEARLSHENASV